MTRLMYGLALSLAFFLSSSALAQMNPAPANPDLRPVLEDFGGEAGLTDLMDDFMEIMLENPQLRPFFVNTNQDRVKRQLVEQFCVILGGDCAYTGRSMRDSHAHLNIDRADFNALVEDLQIAMNRQGIPFRSQNKLLAELAPMYREIITQ
ncbi:group I truncated hemoglobin [Halomonas alkalisoli]|uniref:group I truncated hemoglobin n=1 Tax=Halomonas alkalisoli TaxID=2907158 RepID=UPI001F29C6E9|nr:group 1 truncated hemoglobin [Halomonas alkalisoli]MCE9684140.1 group 1 truncated hemoglobin [Halomonas alkalisoli]